MERTLSKILLSALLDAEVGVLLAAAVAGGDLGGGGATTVKIEPNAAALARPLASRRHARRLLNAQPSCDGAVLNRALSTVSVEAATDASNLVKVTGVVAGGGDQVSDQRFQVVVCQKLASGDIRTVAVDQQCFADANCNHVCTADFAATVFESSSEEGGKSIDIPFQVYLTESELVEGNLEHYRFLGKDFICRLDKRTDGSTHVIEVVNEQEEIDIANKAITQVDDTTKHLGDTATILFWSALKGFLLDWRTVSAQYVLRSPSGEETAPKDLIVDGAPVRMEAVAAATDDLRGVALSFTIKEDANHHGTAVGPSFYFDVYWSAEQVAGQRRSDAGRATGMASIKVSTTVTAPAVATPPLPSEASSSTPLPSAEASSTQDPVATASAEEVARHAASAPPLAFAISNLVVSALVLLANSLVIFMLRRVGKRLMTDAAALKIGHQTVLTSAMVQGGHE